MTLTPQQRETLHDALRNLHDTIQSMLRDGSGRAETVELDQSRMGRLSRIDAIQQQKMAQANLARQRVRLERVEAAIERLEDEPEEYGLCPDCGEDIPFPRLIAAPDAIFCVDCASERQRRRRR